MRRALAVLLAVALAGPALAQQSVSSGGAGNASGGDSIGALVARGYEIKAAAPNADKFVVFLQKDSTAFACEFVTVSRSRCEQIN